jgi:hypothetical protein
VRVDFLRVPVTDDPGRRFDAEAALREELHSNVGSRIGFPKNARLGEPDAVEP